MKCNNCQALIPEGARFCPGCGTKVDAQQAAPETKPTANSFIGALNNINPFDQESDDQQPATPEPVQESVTPEPAPEETTAEPVEQQSAPQPEPMPFGAEPVEPRQDYTDSYDTDSFGEIKSHRKRFPVVPIIVIAVIAIVIGVAAKFMLGGGMGSGGKYVKTAAVITYEYNAEEDETYVLYNEKVLGSIDGDDSKWVSSADGTVEAVRTVDGTLYAVDKDGITEIADDVVNMIISQNGKYIVYYDEDNTICKVSADGKDEEVISEDQDGYIRNLALSPDGKSLVYCFADGDDVYSAAYINGKEVELDEEFIGVAISNDGKIIIGADADSEDLCTYDIKSEKMEKIASVDDCNITPNCKEIIYEKSGKYYLYIDGESKKIGKYESLSPIYSVGQDVSVYNTFVGIPLKFTDSKGNYGIGYLKKDGTLDIVAEDLDTGYFTAYDNAKTIIYHSDGKIYKATEKDDYKAEKIVKGVYNYNYTVSIDGKKIYYMDDDYTLYLFDGEDDIEIEEEVRAIHGIDSNGAVYFTVGDESPFELYRYDGKDAELVAEDVSSVTVNRRYIKYRTVDEDDGSITGFYISKDGKEFETVYEN